MADIFISDIVVIFIGLDKVPYIIRVKEDTFYSPEFLTKSDKISPFHVAPPYKAKDLFSRKHWHALQILPINTIFFENLPVATQVYFFQPHTNILGIQRQKTAWSTVLWLHKFYTEETWI